MLEIFRRKMTGWLIIAMSLSLFGCQSKKAEETNTTSDEQVSEYDDSFEMDHEIRKGFILSEKSEVNTNDYIPINSVSELKTLDRSKKSYILMTDLDMSGVKWSSIDFYGHLEGNHHVISGLQESSLFSALNGQVQNLGFENADVSSAALAKEMWGGSITNCYVTGTVKGHGGLIGKIDLTLNLSGTSAKIEYCYNAADIDGTSESGGTAGVVGEIDMSGVGTRASDIWINSCENYGTIRGRDISGGIIGKIVRGATNSGYYHNSKAGCYITKCFNYSSVSSNKSSKELAGGIVGVVYATNATNDYQNEFYIRQSANYGDIDASTSSNYYQGGICGKVSLRAAKKSNTVLKFEIENCLNTGNTGFGICGDIEINYGTCNLYYCLSIDRDSSICQWSESSYSEDKVFNMEECYKMKISEMKNMSKNLPKFDYPGIWGITELYNGLPHPYGEDEQEAVNEYYNAKHQKEVEQQSDSMTEEEIVLNGHYADMLEGMNYTGYWVEDENFENQVDYLTSYGESTQASFDIVDVNKDGKNELVVMAGGFYKIYTYDKGSNKAEKIYSTETEEQWKSDYGKTVDVDWKVMKPENYSIYRDTYESLFKKKLSVDLKEDIGTYFVENDANLEKVKEHLSSQFSVEFKENEDMCISEGSLNDKVILSMFSEDGGGLTYNSAVNEITVFGIKPGISEEEAKNTISQYGFYKGKYASYKMGKYLLGYTVENGIIKDITMSSGSEFVG